MHAFSIDICKVSILQFSFEVWGVEYAGLTFVSFPSLISVLNSSM